jgi:hypothetical protein
MMASSLGGVKWVDVSAERFPGWVTAFARRHGESGPLGITLAGAAVVFAAPDGAVAECHPPFAESFAWPIHWRPFIGQALGGSSPREMTAPPPELASPDVIAAKIAAHAQLPRAVGVLLVRLGGYAAGVFTGYPPALADAKVGSRPVHGRSAAGGWSQHRFARRREKQASEALDAAADTAAAVFARWASGITATGAVARATSAPARTRAAGTVTRGGGSRPRSEPGATASDARAAAGRGPQLDALVLGGDKRAVAELRDDPRLAPYLALATDRFLTVPDPKRAVLEGTPKLFTAVRVKLTEPAPGVRTL